MTIAGESGAGRSQERRSTTPAISSASGQSSRRRMVQDRLGLTHDPFLYAVAEIEVQARPDDYFAYFVKPDAQLWDRLLSAHHVVLFGEYGSGKTTLRLNLARLLRDKSRFALAVTCDFGGYAGVDKLAFLAQQIAKDLLIQTLEMLDLVDDARHQQVIRQLSGLLHERLRATLVRVVQAKIGERIDRLLAGRGRESNDYLELSPALHDFLQKLLDASVPEQAPPEIVACLEAAQQLDFSEVYILADGFDAHQSSVDEIAQTLHSLAAVTNRYTGRLVMKVFLPAAVKKAVAGLLDELSAMTGGQAVVVDLIWEKERVSEVLAQRFRAAERPDLPTFDGLAAPDARLPRDGIDMMSARWDAQARESK